MTSPRWLVDHLEELTGLSAGRSHWPADRSAPRPSDGPAPAPLSEALLAQDEVAALIDAVTVNESYFHRDARQMAMLQEEILPELAAASSRTIGVWSAGCATGEEAYTVAMAAGDIGLLPRVQVLGTDLSARAIAAAQTGRYGRWSLRVVDEATRRRWFVTAGDLHEPRPAVRERVRFRAANLLDGPPGRFDLVLCRNLLMYLTPEALRRATDVLTAALTDDGWLVTGASDPMLECDGLCPVRTRFGLAYRRQAATHPAPARRPDVVPDPPPVPAAPARPGPHAHLGPDPERSAPEPSLRSARRAGGASVDEHTVPDALEVARDLADRGVVARALEVVAEGVDRDPFNAELRLFGAMLHLEVGEAGTAVTEARRALYLDDSLAVAHLVQGHALRLQGDRDAAAQSFDRAARALAELPEDAVSPGAHDEPAGHLAAAARRLAASVRA